MATVPQSSPMEPDYLPPEESSVESVESSSFSSTTPPEDTLASPTQLDFRRYWANRAGQSVADLAKLEEVSESTISASLQRVRNDNERYSSLGAGVETRKLYMQALPKIQTALDDALIATRLEGKEVIIFDKETGKAKITKEPIERPDHDTRLRAVDSFRTLLSVVQPRDPAVQITTNTQTNVLNQAALPAGAGQAGLTSPEAVIRSIVAARQHALTSGNPTAEPTTIEPTEGADAMPRVRKNDLEEDELELLEDSDDELDEDIEGDAAADDEEE